MSADRQDPVSLVEDMIKEWQNGNKIVIGTRIDREDKWFSKFTVKFNDASTAINLKIQG